MHNMNLFLPTIKHLHFIGIGGIGMSGIAEILHGMGYTVTGSDSKEGVNTKRLQAKGIKIFTPQAAENIIGADVIVVSTAIRPCNVERKSAEGMGIQVVHRSEVLSEILRHKLSVCVSGTHGKTTTTSIIANLFDTANLDPMVINGGIINAYGSNAKEGSGQWAIAEADESDSSMVRIHTTYPILTNIDPEHMDHYGTFDKLKETFLRFIDDIPFYGAAILCFDHPVVREIAKDVTHRNTISYGLGSGFDISAQNITYSEAACHFDILFSDRILQKYKSDLPCIIKNVTLSTVGEHNVQNCLSAIAMAVILNMSEDVIRKSLTTFEGVQRRFTITGRTNQGATIVDDYAHHPVEVKALIQTAKKTTKGRIFAIMQPHKYSRLKDMFKDFSESFNGADEVLITPVYAAGQEPIIGACSNSLAEAINKNGVMAQTVESVEEASSYLAKKVRNRDIVLCIGAGDITKWAYEIPTMLDKINVAA